MSARFTLVLCAVGMKLCVEDQHQLLEAINNADTNMQLNAESDSV